MMESKKLMSKELKKKDRHDIFRNSATHDVDILEIR